MTLQRFQGEHPAVPKLNAVVEMLNALRGDGTFISLAPSGLISFNWQAMLQRVPRAMRGERLLFAKVTKIKSAASTDWVDFVTSSGYQMYAETNPCGSDGSSVDTGTTIHIGLTDSPATAFTGYELWAVGDVIPYLPGDGLGSYDGVALYTPGKLGPPRAHGAV
jgi:hypothetical protein